MRALKEVCIEINALGDIMTIYLSQILKETRDALKQHYENRLVQLTLYGSQARGDAETSSDIDILVVLKSKVNPAKEIIDTEMMIAKISLNYDIALACYFVSEKEYLESQSPIMRNIRREGITV